MKSVQLCIILSIFLIFSGCSHQEANDERVYRIANEGDWGLPSPYGMVTRGPGFSKMYLVFDTLLWQEASGEVKGALAESWVYLAEEKAYRVQLREGVLWHDSQPMTAEDLMFTIEYIKDHPLPWLDLDVIDKAFMTGDREVTISLKDHYAPFTQSIGCGMPILPKHIYEKIDAPYEDLSLSTCIGTGPYKLKAYNPEEENYAFEAFDAYYQGQPYIKDIHYIGTHLELQPSAIENGQLDLMRASGEAAERLKESGFKVARTKGLVVKLKFNTNKSPFNQQAFRHAVAYAIDVPALIDIAQQGHGYPAESGFIDNKSSYYNSDIKDYKVDLNKSNQLMKDLGYEKKNGFYEKDGQRLTIELLGYDIVNREVDVLVNQLRQAGFYVEAAMKDIPSHEQLISQGQYDLAIESVAVAGDPIYLNRMILAEGGMNDHADHSLLIELLQQQVHTYDEESRMVLLREIQSIYSELLPSYALFHYEFNAVYNHKIDVYYMPGGFGIGIDLPYNKEMYLNH